MISFEYSMISKLTLCEVVELIAKYSEENSCKDGHADVLILHLVYR